MNILVVGNGGREHAIIDKLSQSLILDKLYALPGNYGISLQAQNVDIDLLDNDAIVKFALNNQIDLVIIGPESALSNGLSDELNKANIRVFGPSKAAAMIEASKEFAKEIMKKYDIPTADYQGFNDYNKAIAYLNKKNEYPIVIKYDGLAAGKGVYIVQDFIEASKVLDSLLNSKDLGDDSLIIEDFLEGDEFTVLSFVKNDKVYPLQCARDFKRVYDNDEGLNTGGMGAICPYHNVSDKDLRQAHDILNKAAVGLLNEDRAFLGILYGGFIKTKHGVKVIEFNARFGDPETEVVLNNINEDLLKLIVDFLDDKIINITFKDQVSVGVVLAAPNYPQAYKKDIKLKKYLELPFKIYHMQTKLLNNDVVSDGGRVLFVLNEAKNSNEAFNQIYDKLDEINDGTLHYRHDLDNY